MLDLDGRPSASDDDLDPTYRIFCEMDDEKVAVGVNGYADRFDLSPRTVLRRIKAGKIPSILSGGRRLIPKLKTKTVA